VEETETVERVAGVCGELVLRRRGEHHEIVANGTFLMDTRGGTSERLLVTAAADHMPAPGRIMIGGLGVGFSLAAALAHPGVSEVHVVEREPAVVRWNSGPLAPVHGDALRDPRVRVHVDDVVAWLEGAAPASLDAVCLDVDNGPDALDAVRLAGANGPAGLVTPDNARLYSDAGLAALVRVLAPGGVLAVWSAQPAPAFEARMRLHLDEVEVVEVAAGTAQPDVVLLGRRPLESVRIELRRSDPGRCLLPGW